MKTLKNAFLVTICAVSVVLFTGCSMGGGSSSRQDMSKMIERMYPTVVSIEAVVGKSKYCGAGVVFYSTPSFNLVATNAHVVANGEGEASVFESINIIHWSQELYDGELETDQKKPNYAMNSNTYSTSVDIRKKSDKTIDRDKLLYWNIEEDLAIIKVTNPPSGFGSLAAVKGLRGGKKDEGDKDKEKAWLRVGEPIAALGYSSGQFYRASVGVVTQIFPSRSFEDESGINKKFDYCFMHDAITIQGNSGGPVFDSDGWTVGLTTMVVMMDTYDKEGQKDVGKTAALGFSIAISSRHIANVVNKHMTGETWTPCGGSITCSCK